MKLKSVTLANYRCYKNPVSVNNDAVTTLVGRNDIGKSALLDALDVFFNGKALDKNDAAKGGIATSVSITCVFGVLPSQLILDENAPTSLAREYLLNADGDLEITKVFNCSVDKPKLSALRLTTIHPSTNGAKGLLELKIDQLKQRAQEIGIDMQVVNKTVKHELPQRNPHQDW